MSKKVKHESLKMYADNVQHSEINKKDIQQRIFQNEDCSLEIPHSVLHIRKTATNFFITFSVSNKVLYSSSAGSAGVVGKKRRRFDVVDAVSKSFQKFVRYYVRAYDEASVFKGIIVRVSAPVKLVRWFLRNIRRYFIEITSRHNELIMHDALRMKGVCSRKRNSKHTMMCLRQCAIKRSGKTRNKSFTSSILDLNIDALM